jgi:hypothetical protein
VTSRSRREAILLQPLKPSCGDHGPHGVQTAGSPQYILYLQDVLGYRVASAAAPDHRTLAHEIGAHFARRGAWPPSQIVHSPAGSVSAR